MSANCMCRHIEERVVQGFAGWLAQICGENSRMRKIFNSKSPPKVCACADFHRKFVPTNLQTYTCIGISNYIPGLKETSA